MADALLDTSKYEKELSGEQAALGGVYQQVADVSDLRAKNIEAQQQESKPFIDLGLKKAGELSALAEQPLPKSEAAGMVFAPHEVDPKQIQGLSFGLIGMALLGGAVSKGNWLGVSASLNGALEGFIDGDQMRRDREWEDFQRKFSVAEKHDKEALDRIEKTITNKNLSLNAIREQVNLIATEHGMEDMRLAAKSGSFDAIIHQHQARITSLEGIISRKENLQATLGAAMERKKTVPGMGVELDPDAKVAFDTINSLTAGKSDLVKPINSRFSRMSAVPNFNRMFASIQAKNPNMTPEEIGADLVKNAIKYGGDTAAYRTNLTREVGVARLALAVQGMQANVLAAAKKYGVSDAPWANKSLNAIRSKLGDADYVKFRNEIVAVARQYIEAVTMPGSNAQLHASSQETADKMISDDMTIDQIRGAFEAMNEEIGSTGDALQTINERLLDSLGKKDLKGLFSYKGDAAAKSNSQALKDADAVLGLGQH